MTRVLILAVLALSAGSAAAQSLTLSPAVVPLGGHPGQSTTQRLTLHNGTTQVLAFALVAKDIVVRGGARAFVAAGEQPGGIAASAVFSTRAVTLQPNEERAVDVTVTLPQQTAQRAVIILFEGTTRLKAGATVSLGALLTFDLAGRSSIAAGDLHATAPTPSANAAFELPMTNDGAEPAIVRGAVALLDAQGGLQGKVVLEPHRLLPGERATLHADYPSELRSGTYRVVATFATPQRSWSRLTVLSIP